MLIFINDGIPSFIRTINTTTDYFKSRYSSFNKQSKFVHEKGIKHEKVYNLGGQVLCVTQPYVSNPNISNVLISE